MTTFQVIVIIVVFSLVHFSNNVTITDTSNIFYDVNERILTAIEDLFIYLKINKDFTQSKIVQEYMSMHSFVQGAVRENNRRYKEIRNIIKSNINNKTAQQISSVNEVIDEMIREQAVKYNDSVRNDASNFSAKIDTFDGFVDLANVFNLKIKALTPNYFNVRSSNSTSQEVRGRRIFAGSSTTIERYPFMVSVHVNGRFVCAGSLVHESLALSAGSCLVHTTKDPNSQVQIRVASDYVTKMGLLIQITGLTYHPDFDRTSLANNLVLLKTSKPLRFRMGKMMAIKYDSSQLTKFNDVFILGWGRRSLKEKDNLEDRPLSRAHLDVYDLEECKYIYTRTYVTNKTFCAGFVDRGDGACNHDGGGPAVTNNLLVGVISFGSPACGRADAPTVLTRLGLYSDWIDGVLENVELANPPKFNVPAPINFGGESEEINFEESDTENPRDVLKREFGLEDIIHGPIDIPVQPKLPVSQNPQEHSKNISHMQSEIDLMRMFQEDYFTSNPNLSSDTDLNEQLEDSKELTPSLSLREIPTPVPKNKKVEDEQTEFGAYTYLMKEMFKSTRSNKMIEVTTRNGNEGNYDDIYYNVDIKSESIKTTQSKSFVREALEQDNKGFPTEAATTETLFERLIGSNYDTDKSKMVSQSKLENKHMQSILTGVPVERLNNNDKAVIILSDSGTTQRIEVDKRNPLYEKGIKALVKNINT